MEFFPLVSGLFLFLMYAMGNLAGGIALESFGINLPDIVTQILGSTTGR